MSPTQFSCNCNYSLITHNKTPVHSIWGLLRVCAACPTPRLNLSSELRPSWEQHPRYGPHRVRNGYNRGIQYTYSIVLMVCITTFGPPCIYIYMYVCVCVCLCVCLFVCVCVCCAFVGLENKVCNMHCTYIKIFCFLLTE